MNIFIVFCAFLPLIWSRLVPCATDKGPLPKSVVISGCSNSEDCDFIRGKSVLGDFEFVAQSDIMTLYAIIYMTHGANRNEKALTDAPDDRFFGCDWLLDGFKCPISKGKSATWRLNLPIHSMEKITDYGAIEVQMRAQDNSTQFCAVIWGSVSPF